MSSSQKNQSSETPSDRQACMNGIRTIMVVVALLVMVSIAVPYFSNSGTRDTISEQISVMRSLALACRTYAVDSEGEYPDSLQDLLDEGLIDDPDFLLTEDPDSGEKVNFIYHKPPKGSGDERFAMIISPWANPAGRRMVAFSSSAVAEMKLSVEEIEPSKQGKSPPAR